MARDMLEPFWIVWTDDPDIDVDVYFMRYNSLEAAKNRAMELALDSRARTYVLQVVGRYLLNDPQWELVVGAHAQ